MRLYDKRNGDVVDVVMIGKNGIDWSADFFNAGSLERNEELDAYEVENVDTCIEAAFDWEDGVGDYETRDTDPREVTVEEIRATRSWKVYGPDGEPQGASFEESEVIDCSDEEGIRIIEMINSDRTGTNDYSIIKITRASADECYSEFTAQLYDGAFETYGFGKYEEI